MISKIHSDQEKSSVYFTFEYLWNGNGNLETKSDVKTNTYETVVSDRGNELEDFFERLKPTFGHNRKHDCEDYKTREAWGKRDTTKRFVSQLSCFRERNNDKPQDILNKAIKFKSEYIGYDEGNGVWVRFKLHEDSDNVYHGFDEYDDENRDIIPTKNKRKVP